MTCILGPVLKKETKYYQLDNILSQHCKLREHRFDLIQGNILYHFEVYRFSDKSRQVHGLLEDGNILIFNKNNKKIITTMLLDIEVLNEYINKIPPGELTYKQISKMVKCVKLNKIYKVNRDIPQKEDIETYLKRKKKLLNIK